MSRQDDDRLVPEIDAVGPDPQPAQRLGPEGTAQPTRGMGACGHDEGRGHRQQDHPPAVDEARVLAGPPEEDEDRHQTDRAESVDYRPPGHASGQTAAGQIIASAAPMNRPNARVSVPSYTREASKLGW